MTYRESIFVGRFVGQIVGRFLKYCYEAYGIHCDFVAGEKNRSDLVKGETGIRR
jgi:hypothetical protein